VLQEKADMLEHTQMQAAIAQTRIRELEGALRSVETALAPALDTFQRLTKMLDAKESQVQMVRNETASRVAAMMQQLQACTSNREQLLADHAAELAELNNERNARLRVEEELRASRFRN